jgi:hypothetical protein
MTDLALPATLADAILLATEYDNEENRGDGEPEFTPADVVESNREGCTHDDIDGAVDELRYRVAFHAILTATDEEITAALAAL